MIRRFTNFTGPIPTAIAATIFTITFFPGLPDMGSKMTFMRLTVLFLVAVMATSFVQWQPDFPTAQKKAKEEGKLILLNFSGSDWCGPCIRLRKEILDSEPFGKLADSSLVLFNADFPRNKKNQLPKEVQRRNDALADQYNPLGKFPFTLLLTAEGKVVRSWEGFPENGPEQFMTQIKSACDASRR